MDWFSVFIIPLIAALGVSLLLPQPSERAKNPWARGFSLWIALGAFALWVSSRAHNKLMFVQWEFSSWALLVASLLLSTTGVVQFLWPKGLGSPSMPGWRLELSVGLVVLAAQLAVIFW